MYVIVQAGEAIIKDSVEPILEDYRPPGISSMKFSKLSLGTVAPKIEGSNIKLSNKLLCSFLLDLLPENL